MALDRHSNVLLKDTQAETDTRGVALAFAGVSSLRRPITAILAPKETCPTVGDFTMGASLRHDERGTHMSRFIEALDDNAHTPISAAALQSLALTIQHRLHADTASVKVGFPFFLKKSSPVSARLSLLEYHATMECVSSSPDKTESRIAVTIPIGTLCPCSKAISNRGAHNQRGEVRLTCEPLTDFHLKKIVTLVESCASSPLYTLLKRDDEKFVTEQAYDNPAFVEDVVRNMALKLADEKSIRLVSLEVENFESIHAHNAWSRL